MRTKIKKWADDHNKDLIVFSSGLVVGGLFGIAAVKQTKADMMLTHLTTFHDELGIVREIKAFHKNGLVRTFAEATPQ